LPQRRHPVFLRRDLRQWADYYANPSIEGTSNIWLRQLSAAPHVKR